MGYGLYVYLWDNFFVGFIGDCYMANEQNLKPFTGADDPRRGHKKKGTKHLSTIIQELANDIDWDKTTLKNKDELKVKYGKNGFKAVAYVALTKAMTGDTKAMEWLAKHGYGNTVNLHVNKDPVDEILKKFGIEGVGSARQTEADASESPQHNS